VEAYIETVDREKAADFMIVSVTRIEYDVIEHCLQPVCPDGTLDVDIEGRKYKLGKIGGFNVVCCKCKTPGTIGAESATLTPYVGRLL